MSDRGGKRTILTARQKSIIRILADMEAKAITVAAIAEKLDVSKRTILREIPVVEDWMEENDFIFSRKPGVGLSIDENEENICLIKELLEEEKADSQRSREERQSFLLGILLFENEPVKSQYLTSKFRISDSTLFSDLDTLNEWLQEYHMQIVRKPGVGIRVEGEEFNLRQAITNAVFEFCDVNVMLHVSETEDEKELAELSANPLLCFWQMDNIRLVRILAERCEAGLNITFADVGRIGLMIRLAVIIHRMESGFFITEAPELRDRITIMAELSMSRIMAELIRIAALENKGLSLEIPEAEIDHMAMLITVTRVKTRGNVLDNPRQVIDIHMVIMSMIGVVEQLTELPLSNDRTLIEDLTHHIMTMTRRLSADVILSRPEIDDLRKKYPGIYAASEAACKILSEWIAPYEIRESDQGYIAMHFIAAAIRIEENDQKIAVAVVCPAGIASSRMLASGLRQKFPNLEVKKIISAFSLKAEDLYRDGIELLISTVKISVDFPYLEVNKILQAGDQARIQNEINKITQERLLRKTSAGKTYVYNDLTLEDVKKISAAGTEITKLIETFGLWDIEGAVADQEELFRAASLFMADGNASNALAIAEGFRRRESRGSTYIKEMKIFLLHCRAAVKGHSRFGYVRLKQPSVLAGGPVEGAICMLVPEEQKDTFYLDIIGRISELLVEEPGFLTALKRGDKTGSVDMAEKVLLKYFNQLIN